MTPPPFLVIAAAGAILWLARWRQLTVPPELDRRALLQDTLLTWALAFAGFWLFTIGLILGIPAWTE